MVLMLAENINLYLLLYGENQLVLMYCNSISDEKIKQTQNNLYTTLKLFVKLTMIF